MLISLHILDHVCRSWSAAKDQGETIQSNWMNAGGPEARIPERVVRFAFHIGKHFESQWQTLDVGRPGHQLPEEETTAPPEDPPHPLHSSPRHQVSHTFMPALHMGALY